MALHKIVSLPERSTITKSIETPHAKHNSNTAITRMYMIESNMPTMLRMFPAAAIPDAWLISSALSESLPLLDKASPTIETGNPIKMRPTKLHAHPTRPHINPPVTRPLPNLVHPLTSNIQDTAHLCQSRQAAGTDCAKTACEERNAGENNSNDSDNQASSC